MDVLALSSPETFGRSSRVRQYVRQLVLGLGLADPWRFETAALLSQIGYVAVPPDILHRRSSGEPLSASAASFSTATWLADLRPHHDKHVAHAARER